MAKGLILLTASEAVAGIIQLRPRWVGGEVALLGSHLVDASGHELA